MVLENINNKNQGNDLKTSNLQNSKWAELMESKFSSSNLMVDLIKSPVITEKSYFALFKNKQYTFDVDLRLTKPQIKKLFEKLFDPDVLLVD